MRHLQADVQAFGRDLLAGSTFQVEKLCPPQERLLCGAMDKKVMTSKGIEWQPRFAVLR